MITQFLTPSPQQFLKGSQSQSLLPSCACVLSRFSPVQLCAHWTVAHQAPVSMGLSRQEYWSGLLCPPPGDLPNSGIEPVSLTSPALAGGFFPTSHHLGSPFYNLACLEFTSPGLLPTSSPMAHVRAMCGSLPVCAPLLSRPTRSSLSWASRPWKSQTSPLSLHPPPQPEARIPALLSVLSQNLNLTIHKGCSFLQLCKTGVMVFRLGPLSSLTEDKVKKSQGLCICYFLCLQCSPYPPSLPFTKTISSRRAEIWSILFITVYSAASTVPALS